MVNNPINGLTSSAKTFSTTHPTAIRISSKPLGHHTTILASLKASSFNTSLQDITSEYLGIASILREQKSPFLSPDKEAETGAAVVKMVLEATMIVLVFPN